MTNSELVSLDSVSFRRSGRDILQSISMDIRSDEVVTLIGPNGGGKSTVLLMLAGLVRPTDGMVTVGGTPAHELALNAALNALHHNPSRPAWILLDRLFLFAVPALVWALAGVVSPLRRRLAGVAGVAAPLAVEGALFLSLVVLYGVVDLFGMKAHNLHQTLAYGVFVAAGLRAARALR